MRTALYLLCSLAILGGADTLYYHEWRARLPAMGRRARSELELHALRDFVYAVLFSTLPWIAWRGAWAIALAVLLLAEIVLTLWDFVVEDWVRKSLGGLYPGERIMHAVMGILYGAMLAYLLPNFVDLVECSHAAVGISNSGLSGNALGDGNNGRGSACIRVARLVCVV